MKSKWFSCFVRQTYLIFLLPYNVIAESNHRYVRRIPFANFDTNRIQAEAQVPVSTYDSYVSQSGNDENLAPKESMVTFVTKHKQQSPTSNFQRQTSATNFQHRSPTMNIERQFNESESHYRRIEDGPRNAGEYSSYNTARAGDESAHEENYANGDRPRQFTVSYPEPYDHNESKTKLPHEMYANGKKFGGKYEKSYKEYRHRSYSKHGGDDDNSYTPSAKTEPSTRPEALSKPRSFSVINSETRNHPLYSSSLIQKTDVFPPTKNTKWKQLGPNVEISAPADNAAAAVIYRENDVTFNKEQRKKPKKRKNHHHKMRTGYTTAQQQQHALYFANNLLRQNVNSPTEDFDHGNVLKQSDKFDLADAMSAEHEKENARKNDVKVRIKQEAQKSQPYNFEIPNSQNYRFFAGAAPPIAAPVINLPYPIDVNQILANKYAGYNSFYQSPAAAALVSKAFVKNIEIETSSGGKKSITALVIPLDPSNGNAFAAADGPSYNAEILQNQNTKTRNSFPYDIVNARYIPNDLPSYPFKQYIPYQFRIGQHVDDDYNPYAAAYSQQSVYSRDPFGHSSTTYAPSTGVDDKPVPTDATYSTASSYPNQSRPFSIVIPNNK